MIKQLIPKKLRRRLAASSAGQILRYGWAGRQDHKGFPQWVHIENTNRCPARCSMCMMDQMQRETGTMEFALFQKIVDECARYKQVEQIHLHGFGEPLLDKNLPRKVRYVKEHTRAFTYIVTTINIMTESFARELITAGLDGMKVSLYGNTASTYESIHRRLRFEKTLQALEMFLRVRDELRAPNPSIRVQFAEGLAPTEELVPWANRWGPKLDADRGDVLLKTSLHNWAGASQSDLDHLPEAERYCIWPFHDIQVLWDGRVAPCCFDYEGSLVLGNVREQTVREVWTGEKYEAFRNAWRARKSSSVPVCAECDTPDGKYAVTRLPPAQQPKSRGIVVNGQVRPEAAHLVHD